MKLVELKIAQAYVRLSSLPEESSAVSVSLASIGSCEIRMVRWPEIDIDRAPLFWLELFDHSIKSSVDSFCCCKLKDAVPIFDDFVTQARGSNKSGDFT
jgi:hypothetical protein